MSSSSSQEIEEKRHADIRSVYNSGDCARAVQMAIEFLNDCPQSIKAQYAYAVMHGDFADSPVHTEAERKNLREIARGGISKLFHDPRIAEWDEHFQTSVRNEYFWFFELHEEQYNLGANRLRIGKGGNYSACVGASMMALKELRALRVDSAEMWAERSIHHFQEFQKSNPTWYNINFFAAQAMACLGDYDEALRCFEQMYQKQKAPENKLEIEQFQLKLENIKRHRDAS